MVTEIKEGYRKLYLCDECGLVYNEEKWANMCEEYCSEHHACSLEITRHAVRSSHLTKAH